MDAKHFVFQILSIIEHPKYVPFNKTYVPSEDPDYDYEAIVYPPLNDIAIIELDKVVDLKSYPHIKPVCLPYMSHISDFVGLKAIVTGWGYEEPDHGYFPFHLKEVDVTVLGKQNCGNMTEDVRDGSFCAGYLEGMKDGCQGDSGGPLIIDDPNKKNAFTLIGLVSWGASCGKELKPGVYTDVPYYTPWLIENMQNFNTCPAPENAGTMLGTTTLPPTLPPPESVEYEYEYKSSEEIPESYEDYDEEL